MPKAARLFGFLEEEARQQRNLTTIQTFEAGRAIEELVDRYQSGVSGIPISSRVEWVPDPGGVW
jgi:hypothetical protein